MRCKDVETGTVSKAFADNSHTKETRKFIGKLPTVNDVIAHLEKITE